jgi:Asp-tRNA(Asn)/Glu-tRNA(Gln) amidotransferase A subunit family amidase
MKRNGKLRGYVALAEAFRSGTTTPRAYLDETLSLIDRHDSRIKAFVATNREGAIHAANASTARWRNDAPLSPIDGMPLAIKDVIETIDLPTGQGSLLLEGTMSGRDAASVRALREAGAVIVGKTTTTEFASFHAYHETLNPCDDERSPGGSSSGSAAAVGAGMVPVALGTQVVGSILRPASYCGAVGFKPSHGAINRSGSHDHFSQGCLGAIGATLSDTWAALRAIAERAGGDPGHAGLAGDPDLTGRTAPKRIAVLETGGWSSATEGARAAMFEARRRLADEGIELRSRADDPAIEALEQAIADALPLTLAINTWEGRWPRNTYTDRDVSKLSASAIERVRAAEAMTQNEYRELLVRRSAMRARFAELADRYDVFATLGASGAAPIGLGSTGNVALNTAASSLGVPALTVPVLQDQDLPLGLQLLGSMDRDATVFGAAAWVLRSVFDRQDLIGPET